MDGAPGGNMRTSFMLIVLLSGVLSANMNAAMKTGELPATVVSVESHGTQSDSNYAGTNPSDFTPHSEFYTYDVGIRVGSTVYRASYESALNYVPAIFAANHPIQVTIKKHVMYVTLPGDDAVQMAIEGRVQDTPLLAGY
jgi:hypothetical protein